MTRLKEMARQGSARARETLAEFRGDVSALTKDVPLAELNPRIAPSVPPPWDELWRKREIIWWTAGTAVIVTPILALGLAFFSRALGSAVVFLGFGLIALSVLRLGWFTCPRCGRRFDTVRKSRHRRWSNNFTRRCLYCGLEAGTSARDWSGD